MDAGPRGRTTCWSTRPGSSSPAAASSSSPRPSAARRSPRPSAAGTPRAWWWPAPAPAPPCSPEHMISMGESGGTPRRRLVQMAQGLGFAPDLVIDQHFRRRDRMGRLLTALSYNPEPLGVGIDEDTAAMIDADGDDHRARRRRGDGGRRLGPALHRQPRRPPRPAGRHAGPQARLPHHRLPLRPQAAGGGLRARMPPAFRSTHGHREPWKSGASNR